MNGEHKTKEFISTRITSLATCFEPNTRSVDLMRVSQETAAEPTKESARSHRYRPDIDGLRALAILPVILFHADLGCSGGFVGVDVFFVISGFLITSLILNEIDDNCFSLVNFWERRVRRILPALVTVVFATLVAGWFLYLPHDFALLGQSTVAQAVLTSNFYFWQHSGYFDAASETLPLLHTWSLAVEEQFYLLFPPLLLLLARRKRRSIAPIILGLCIGSFVLSVLCSLNQSANYYLLPTRAWELLLGALLSALPARLFIRPSWNEAISLSGLALILYSIFHYTRQTVFPGPAAVPPCLGTALLIYSGGGRPTVISRMLTLRPIVLLGLISYSLYLWHWPLLVFAQYISIAKPDLPLRACLLVLSAIFAMLSWKFIEAPFRKRLFCPRRPQLFAAASLSVLLLIILGGAVYMKRGVPTRLPAQALAYQTPNFNTPFFTNTYLSGKYVELGAQSTNQPIEIILWGDSHAMAVAPALDELGRRFSVRGVEVTHSATAPLLGHYQLAHRLTGVAVPNFGQTVVEFVAKNHVRTVVIAACWFYYRPPEVVGARLAETAQALMNLGARVYVLKDVPDTGFDVPRVATLTALRHGSLAELSISPQKYVRDNRDYAPIFEHLTQMGVTILDTPKYLLNAAGRYDVARNGKLLYSDNAHLTAEGAMLLIPMFEPLFQAGPFK